MGFSLLDFCSFVIWLVSSCFFLRFYVVYIKSRKKSPVSKDVFRLFTKDLSKGSFLLPNIYLVQRHLLYFHALDGLTVLSMAQRIGLLDKAYLLRCGRGRNRKGTDEQSGKAFF